MPFSLKDLPEIPRIDEPDKIDQKSGEEEHNGLLFHNAELFMEDIRIESSFHNESQNTCGKEQAQRIFKHEASLVVCPCGIHFEINQFMDDESEYKLIEDDHCNKIDEDDDGSRGVDS
jgi:hypothetical protein